MYRSDGSGTTAVFAQYLSKTDSAWRESLGEGKSLSFPAGVAAKGNPGVAGVLAETEGAIGYIGSEYALALNLPTARLLNRAGHFVKAEAANVAAAAADLEIPADTRAAVVDSPAPEAYPISTFTWIVAYREQAYNKRTLARARALAGLLDYILGDEGQAIASQTYYVPLPAAVRLQAGAVAGALTFGGNALPRP